MGEMSEHQTTKEDVAALLENFADYVNPEGKLDPWFTLSEINQQFAWDDVADDVLTAWLNDLVLANKAVTEIQEGEAVYRWLS